MTFLTRIARRAGRAPALMRRFGPTHERDVIRALRNPTARALFTACCFVEGVFGVHTLAFAYGAQAIPVPVVNSEASVTVSNLDSQTPNVAMGNDTNGGVSRITGNSYGNGRGNEYGNGNGNGNAYADANANGNTNPYGTSNRSVNDVPQSAANADGTQDLNVLQNAAEAFLMQQTDGLPGHVVISLTPSTARGLTACPALEPFLPPGVRLWGRAMVGVRCNGERPWTIYLQARIGVIGDYYVAARTLNAGDSIGMQDLSVQHGDLTTLPGAIITNPSQVVGAVAMNRVSAGMPLRSDLIKAALAIRYGQQVKVVASGTGFSVQSEGSALANAAPGQPVRVRTGSGVIISGIARADASVDVPL